MKKVQVKGNFFYNSDCILGAKQHIADNSIDLIITDPPYGIEGQTLHKHYNRNEGNVIQGYVEVPKKEYAAFSQKWINEAERILKPSGQIYIVSGYTNLYHILHALRSTKLKEINHIIWKYNFGVFTRRKYVSSHYHILYYEKPGKEKRKFNLNCRFGLSEKTDAGRSLNYQDREDVWIINREYKAGREKNKNELPQKLLMRMIQYSSNPGDLICDLFLGGFSTAEVAVGLKRKFVGFEISSHIFDKKIKAMKNLKSGFLMDKLRKPAHDETTNQGKRWSKEEIEKLILDFSKLYYKDGKTKQESIDLLSKKFKRGKWGILKILNAEKGKTKIMNNEQ
ncbi:MAG: site-specific DNA-methyltransferase [Candidatus Cloacimonadota bacterium]|nr:site-specific DNA-methyltransferase [Candidatus Cloacimonadota bacterium]